MDNQNNAIVNIPKCLDGKFYTILNSELEFISFLNDKNKSLSCLDNYPQIKKIFIKYNTSLTSSAAVERLFSFAGLIHSPCRSSMSDETFKKLVSLKGNQEFISKHGI